MGASENKTKLVALVWFLHGNLFLFLKKGGKYK
jgi:hypothetical protein